MDLDEESFLDELMSLRQDAGAGAAGVAAAVPWQPCPGEGMMMSDLLFYGGEGGAQATSGGMVEAPPPFQGQMQVVAAPMPPIAAPHAPHPHGEFSFDYLSEVCNPYRGCVGAVPVVDQAGHTLNHPLLHDAMVEDGRSGGAAGDKARHGGVSSSSPTLMFGLGAGGESSEMTSLSAHSRSKLHGAPSKNLMAERRRRKRLNDRLSMLRSIVPKISKMDRTSILGDTIDYVKELTERIETLEKEIGATPEELNLLNTIKDFSRDNGEMPVRNSTKFDVERGMKGGTRIEICCPANPGVLLSTVSALDVLGLEIEQCVVSCFSDYAMQASCLQDEGKRQVISTDDIKQALFRSAGYGGRCL